MLTIKAIGLEELIQGLHMMKENINRNYMDAVTKSTLDVEKDSKDEAPVTTGNLRARITHRFAFSPFIYAYGEVGTNVFYAPYVHEGTDPHWPPLEAIVDWVHKKGLTGSYRSTAQGNRRAGSRALQYAEDVSIAYLIQKKIAKSGTKANPFIERAYEKNLTGILDRISDAIKKGVQETK